MNISNSMDFEEFKFLVVETAKKGSYAMQL